MIFNNPVLKSFRVILGGNIATQLVSILAYTYLGRVYSTEDFGFSAFFISASFLFSIFHSGQLYWSLYSDCKEEDLKTGYEDSVHFTIMMTPVLLVVSFILSFSMGSKLGYFWLLVPVFSFFYCLIEINKIYASRLGQYKDSVSQVFYSRTFGHLLKVIFSFFATSGPVLVVSELFGNAFVGSKVGDFKDSIRGFHWRLNLISKYKKFIAYYTPVNFLNLFVQELPVLLSTYFFSLKAAGAFFLVNRLVISPMTLVGNSFAVSQVKKINSYNSQGSLKLKFLLKAYGLMLGLGIAPAIILYFFGGEVFEIILGKNHEETSDLIRSIAPILPFRLIKAMSTVSGVNSDIYRSTLIIKLLTVGSMIFTFNFYEGMSFESMVIIILILEALSDSILAILGLVSNRKL